ncbi:membrane hypothetical protein [Candidatus Xenohaliotis californiensis]|uniref:Phosphatidylglycerophosphate synthase n=1 Tax=Candidatus Xenohaliotis californiensis TaxID=84677 RepID=A0ABP0ERN4_9RICK|nr:membrane hypothetical protein [Candidatus Xenohaliotis californiensis]
MEFYKSIVRNQTVLKIRQYNYIKILIIFNIILVALHFLTMLNFYTNLVLAILCSTIHVNKDIDIGIKDGTIEQWIFYPCGLSNVVVCDILANFIVNFATIISPIILYSIIFNKFNIAAILLTIFILYTTTLMSFVFGSIFRNTKISKVFTIFTVLTTFLALLIYCIFSNISLFISTLLNICSVIIVTYLVVKFVESSIRRCISKN